MTHIFIIQKNQSENYQHYQHDCSSGRKIQIKRHKDSTYYRKERDELRPQNCAKKIFLELQSGNNRNDD